MVDVRSQAEQLDGAFKARRKSTSAGVRLSAEVTGLVREVEVAEGSTFTSATEVLIRRGHAKWKLDRVSANTKSSQVSGS